VKQILVYFHEGCLLPQLFIPPLQSCWQAQVRFVRLYSIFVLTTCAYLKNAPNLMKNHCYLSGETSLPICQFASLLEAFLIFISFDRHLFSLNLNEFMSCMRNLPIWTTKKHACKLGLMFIRNSSSICFGFESCNCKPCKYTCLVGKSLSGLGGWVKAQLFFSKNKYVRTLVVYFSKVIEAGLLPQ